MKIMFTCGGTAGHINPAVALARLFQERHQNCEVLFVGAHNGMERKLVPQEGLPLVTIHASDIHRSFKWRHIKHNLATLAKLGQSRREARNILKEFQPDLVVGTGGYASYPVGREATKMGIPLAIHEANAVPGLTTKMLSKRADRVMVGFEDSRKHYPRPERVVVTGTPVRREFFAHTRKEAREKLGLEGDKPLVLSYWGSLGADVMNRYTVDLLACAQKEDWPFFHIHGAGRNYEWMTKEMEACGIVLPPGEGIQVRPYIYDMPLVMAAADVVICRAGASTISEITSLTKPSILIPSPNVTNNHQEKNARVLEAHQGAVVCLEGETSGQQLYQTTKSLLEDGKRRTEMAQALGKMGVADANEEIYQVLMAYLRRK